MQPQQGMNLIDVINRGAIATYPLIIMSVICVAIVLERLWSLRNLGATTLGIADSILEALKKGQKDLVIAICKRNSENSAGRPLPSAIARRGNGGFEPA